MPVATAAGATTVTLSGGDEPAAHDAVVIGLAPGRDGPRPAPAGGWQLTPAVMHALAAAGARGDVDELTLMATPDAAAGWPAVTVAVGLGPAGPGGYDDEVLRRAAGAAVRALAGTGRVALALPLATPSGVRAAAEGALLGAYRFDRYRASARAPVGSVVLMVPDREAAGLAGALARARAVAAAVCFARDLVNTPAGDLPPAGFVDLVTAECRRRGLAVTVLDEPALRAGGYGGICGVGQGSAHPPRLLQMTYPGAGAGPRVALAGKGVTFDAGGLSLKRAAGMARMKMDMAGAAAVVAAGLAAADLELAPELDVWVPLVENMPGGGALRPSDVLRMYDGTQVEVVDTDNEGRLVLADVLARAGAERPDLMLDVATLTSAQIVALGSRTTGVMANDDRLRAQVVAAAAAAGELAWGMPLPEHLRPALESGVADLRNHGPDEGAMLAAGLFLREFVPASVSWAHLDIAGPAYHDGPAYGYTPGGATGASVRTLVQLIAGPLTGGPAGGAYP